MCQRRADPAGSRCKRSGSLCASYIHTFIAIHTKFIGTHNTTAGCGEFRFPRTVGKHPTELISTWENTRRGIKPKFSKFIREILRTSNLFLGVIDGLTTGSLPLNRADTGRYRLRPYTDRAAATRNGTARAAGRGARTQTRQAVHARGAIYISYDFALRRPHQRHTARQPVERIPSN